MSSGQKQRILIARAIYKKCPILFLDEATSFIDYSNQIKIIKNIINLKWKITLIFHHHTPEISYLFDKKYALKNGILYSN